MIKSAAKSLTGQLAAATGFNGSQLSGKVSIFMYHRVLSPEEHSRCLFEKALAISTPAFEAHIQYLKDSFTILSAPEFLDLIKTDGQFRGEKFALLTFDDGWRDNYIHAAPVLAQHQVPATLFLATGFIDQQRGFWWQLFGDAVLTIASNKDQNRWQATRVLLQEAEIKNLEPDIELITATHVNQIIIQLKQFPPHALNALTDRIFEIADLPPQTHALSWEQVEEMSFNQWSFGAHTVDHTILTELDENEITQQIRTSIDDLRNRPQVNYTPIFCYPNGDFNRAAIHQIKQNGCQAALSTQTGIAALNSPQLYSLPRINVSEEAAASPALLNYKLFKAARNRPLAVAGGS